VLSALRHFAAWFAWQIGGLERPAGSAEARITVFSGVAETAPGKNLA
jgi:hypothetical protein